MTAPDETRRMTVAQAIVTWLANQFIATASGPHRICGGGFGIFGHGNVAGVGEALYQFRDQLPTLRGQNEPGKCSICQAGASIDSCRFMRGLALPCSAWRRKNWQLH